MIKKIHNYNYSLKKLFMKNILVNKNIRLFDALKKLSLSGEKTLIIINKTRKLLGTISDGDIRRIF